MEKIKSESKGTLFTLRFLNLLIVSVLNFLGFNMITPILAKYAVSSFDTNLTIAGTLSGLFAITALFVRPFSGLLADRKSKKKILTFASIIILIAITGYGLSLNITMLFFFRIIHGIGFAIHGTASIALVSDIVDKSRIGEALSLFSVGYLLTASVGPALGIAISSVLGYNITFIVIAFSVLLSLLFLIPLHQEPMKSKIPIWKDFHIQNLISFQSVPFAAVAGCFSIVNGIISSFLILYADAIHVENIAYYFTAKAITLIFIRLVLSRIIDKVKLAYLLYPALGLGIAAVMLLATASSLQTFLLAAICYAFGAGIGQPAVQAYIIKQNPPERRGVAVSTYYIGSDVGQGIGSPIGGAISDSYGYRMMFGSSSLVFVIAIAIFMTAKFVKKKMVDKTEKG